MSLVNSNRFSRRLKEILTKVKFDLKDAERLSLEIHQAEGKGYHCSDEENILWGKLTRKIVETRVKDK